MTSSATRISLSSFFLTALTLLVLAFPSRTPVQSAALGEGARGMELVGKSDITGNGDIWVHGRFAYLGSYTRGVGVKVVDVSNPGRPQFLGTLAASEGSDYEDVVVISANTPLFQGDLLATGVQGRNAPRGVAFWDVTNPRQPQPLSFLDTSGGMSAGGGVHELFMFQRDNRIFALLAVPGSEDRGLGGDFRIVEATDPRNPRQISDWGVRAKLGLDPGTVNQGDSPNTYCHSAMANQDGTVAYLSYWDAGVIILDISDPANPQYLGRTMYEPGEEGNAHSVWPVNNGQFLLVADEDFSAGGANVHIAGPDALKGPISFIEGALTKPICDGSRMVVEVVYVGRGCPSDAYLADPRGKIALMDSGDCSYREKILRAQEAGAVAVVVAKHLSGSPLRMTGDRAGINIPGVMITQDDGNRIKAALAAGETARVALTPNAWGYLRIFDLSDPTHPQQISSFTTDLSKQCRPPDSGWYTIHNPFVVGNTAYLSWYAEGVRVLDLADPTNPREVGFYVPPDTPGGPVFGGNTSVWGVYVQDDLIYASDINAGLYILRRSGP
jgi:hypothetical protein